MTNNKSPLDKKDIEDGVRRALVQKEVNESGTGIILWEMTFIAVCFGIYVQSIVYGFLCWFVCAMLLNIKIVNRIFGFVASLIWGYIAYTISLGSVSSMESYTIGFLIFFLVFGFHLMGFQHFDDMA